MLGRDQAAAFRLQVVVWRRRRRYTVLANSTEAMEFALTVPWIRGLMTPGSQTAPGVFCLLGALRREQRIGESLRLTLIAIFGAVGTLLRYGIQGLVQVGTGGTFPWGTLLINLTGCFLLGLIGQITLNRMMISPDWRVAITVGFFGGYTTFSSFGWETAKMLEGGEWLPATGYVAASVVIGLLLSVAGIRLANYF
jgi:CrcB protein